MRECEALSSASACTSARQTSPQAAIDGKVKLKSNSRRVFSSPSRGAIRQTAARRVLSKDRPKGQEAISSSSISDLFAAQMGRAPASSLVSIWPSPEPCRRLARGRPKGRPGGRALPWLEPPPWRQGEAGHRPAPGSKASSGAQWRRTQQRTQWASPSIGQPTAEPWC